jgi:hypothetical protein
LGGRRSFVGKRETLRFSRVAWLRAEYPKTATYGRYGFWPLGNSDREQGEKGQPHESKHITEKGRNEGVERSRMIRVSPTMSFIADPNLVPGAVAFKRGDIVIQWATVFWRD